MRFCTSQQVILESATATRGMLVLIMTTQNISMAQSIDLPPSRLCIGITGHREGNQTFRQNRMAIDLALKSILIMADEAAQTCVPKSAKIRLLSPLAQGTDMMAAEHALALGWQVMAPLPVGLDLNIALNSLAATPAEGLAILENRSDIPQETERHIAQMRSIAGKAICFELAEQDELMRALLTVSLQNPRDANAQHALVTLSSERAATAARVVIEQSDILIAIWDGESPGALGGTRHTIKAALQLGVPVVWIDARAPQSWTLLRAPETLLIAGSSVAPTPHEHIAAIFQDNLKSAATDRLASAVGFHTEHWHPQSRRRFHAYRWIESRFGGQLQPAIMAEKLIQKYEAPSDIAQGSAAQMLASASALRGMPKDFVDQISMQILQRFAWADGLATYLSDAYRGGMVASFLLAAAAIIGGVAYLPLAGIDSKWPFALFEFLVLITILLITQIGKRHRWHSRWFQTRRVAEYFRHAPLLLLLGIARPRGQWPQAKDSEWPEYYARETLCELGLPQIKLSCVLLRDALINLVRVHAVQQRLYHREKAKRLVSVHHNLDRISEMLFICAIAAVGIFLALVIAEMAQLTSPHLLHKLAKTFTFWVWCSPRWAGRLRAFGISATLNALPQYRRLQPKNWPRSSTGLTFCSRFPATNSIIFR
jgi:hypothetical protein